MMIWIAITLNNLANCEEWHDCEAKRQAWISSVHTAAANGNLEALKIACI